jgi:hypothetical protein
MLKPLFAGAALMLASATAAQAQALVDGDSTEVILSIAQTFGSAEMVETEPNTPKKITGEISGITYELAFLNCDDTGAACEDINFYAFFADTPPVEHINEWNRVRRFGSAYVDDQARASIEYDINLEHGITEDNMRADFAVWQAILDEFSNYVAGSSTSTPAEPAVGMITGDSTDTILSIALDHGSAELAADDGSAPKITGEIAGVPYELFFMNCDDSFKACEDINFRARYDYKPPLEVINDWNRDRRFGRASVNESLDATVAYDINLEHGISEENMKADFVVWQTIIEEFGIHIGAR